ncbi:unnamed protein product [Arctogadus glacialis]
MFGSLVLFAVVLWFFYFLLRNRRGKNFPPGPSALPLLGNLLEFSSENPIPDLSRLARRYGNVYSLFLGPQKVVVVNGLQALKEAFVTRAADFSGRPHGLLLNDATQRKDWAPGLALAGYDAQWRDHRRFGLQVLRNFGLGKKSMEERILQETQQVVRLLEESAGSEVNPQLLFHKLASNIVSRVVFGPKYDHNDPFMKFSIRAVRENAKILNGAWSMIYDTIPAVRNLPLPFQKAMKNFKELNEKTAEVIQEHKSSRLPGEQRDMVDCYLEEMDKREDGLSFSEDQLCSFAQDLHLAGTDTTSNTLLTGVLYMMAHPHIQERCQQEIDFALEGKDKVAFGDKQKMPYVQAVIHEVQRVANIIPLSIFHCTTKDTQLMGFSLPKGTIVAPNMASVLWEEGQWKFPHDFNPENFLDDQGEFVKPEAFVPFSVGPRACLGEGLARMELFLVFVTLLRRFRFVWPAGAGEPDLSPVFGFAMSPQPYKLEVRCRETADH